MSYTLEVQNLRKDYGAKHAVDDISFKISSGEIVALLGPNGAGKTTTIDMILNILTPTSGKILINGVTVSDDRTAALEQTNFAASYAPLPGNLTVLENLKIFALLYEVSDSKRRIEELLTKFKLEHLQHKRCGVLSSGKQTRASIAKALLNRPKLLVLDEPTASLDPSIAKDIRAAIKEYVSADSAAVLWTSHNMYEVSEVCDRVLFLSAGKIILEGDPKALPTEYGEEDLEDLFIKIASGSAPQSKGAQ